MSRLFISHSSNNDDWAIALKDWLVREGWSGSDDIFLDLDPERGIVAGQRWVRALQDAATRCEAVLFLISKNWLGSKWCTDEYQLAKELHKKLFALLIDDVPLEHLPGGLTAEWQIVRVKGEPAESFLTVHPLTQRQSFVHIASAGLASLKRGLGKAGIGAEMFELQLDPKGPFGWRAPYRGLEALEPEDAAVFFGRDADIVRGIDMLRGLATGRPPRLLVILGASGAGKSSFLRAGLWPRLLRDDAQWLPLRAIRAGRGGAVEGNEGLLAALEDVHRRFGLQATRANLRDRLASPHAFTALLTELREAAARRALIAEPPYPLPVICLDQAEEVFAASAGLESEKLLAFARSAINADAALLLVSIRSDSYDAMQSAKVLTGIDQTALTLGPMLHGEIARVIQEPAEILHRKAGSLAPLFDAAVIERLQQEIEGEDDALPLLAFVLQRLMREHQGLPTIGLIELKRTGGVAAAIESAAEAALDDAGIGGNRAAQRDALRRLFIPRLARIDRDTKAPQRRVARRDEVPGDLISLAQALTQRRLLVVKAAAQAKDGTEAGGSPAPAEAQNEGPTLEVAHEALLRRWPTLADLLAEDRDALLLLDSVLSAATDWSKAGAERKPDYLAHRGSRLSDAQALTSRGADWAREIAPARDYLAACAARETAEREEKEAALEREQARLADIAAAQARTSRLQRRMRWALAVVTILVGAGLVLGFWQEARVAASQSALAQSRVNLLTQLTAAERLHENWDSALRIAVHAVRLALDLEDRGVKASAPGAELALVAAESRWQLILSGHSNTIYSASFNRDGSRIVTSSSDKTARIWDIVTGKEITALSEGELHDAAFSPDGSRIVTAADDYAAIWDAAAAQRTVTLRGHGDWVNSAAFSPDGSLIVTASADKTARIWDAATGRNIRILAGHDDQLTYAAFSPDGSRIVSTALDNTARVWDVKTGDQVLLLKGHQQGVRSANFSPDGSLIATASNDRTVRLWDAANGNELMVLRGHDDAVSMISFSPDGRLIASASADKTVRLWDRAAGKEVAVMRGHEGSVESAAFSPDGTEVVTASADKTARIWTVTPPPKEFVVLSGHAGPVTSVTFSPDDAWVITTSVSDEEVRTARIWNSESGAEISALRGVTFAAVSADGARIVTTAFEKTARIWDASTASEIGVLQGHEGEVVFATFSPDGSRVVTASYDKTARIWDVATAKEIAVLTGHQLAVNSAAFSPDGTRVVTASTDGTARVWDAGSGKQIALLHSQGHDDDFVNALRSASFSPDGSRILGVSEYSTAWVAEIETGKELAYLKHDDFIYSGAFSPDGSRIVTASKDKTARIWNGMTGQEIAVLRGHDDEVLSAWFSSDGKRIVTASKDKTARLWDGESGKEIAVLSGQEGAVHSAIFSHNGARLATASDDGTARVWDVRFNKLPKDILADVCRRRLKGISTLSRDEMRLSGNSDGTPQIDVCAGIE